MAPGKFTLRALGRAVGRTMELRFARQRGATPARIGGGFRLAHVDGPIQRQRNLLKHRPVMPIGAALDPETRAANAVRVLPFPGLRSPEKRVAVSTGAEEFEKLLVGHFVRIDGESGYAHAMRGEFVVPAKALRLSAAGPMAWKAERRRACGYLDAARRRRRCAQKRGRGGRNLSVEGQMVKHVGERFGVHQPVLDGHMEDKIVLEVGMCGPSGSCLPRALVDRRSHPL